MKNIILIVFLAMVLFGCNKSDNPVYNYGTPTPPPPPSSSGMHIINAGGTSFSPNSVNAHIGDTVKFIWSSGTHTTTSTTVPTGAATWDAPLNASSTTFIYIISVAGSYNYKCTFHESMGMIGSFTVN